MVRPRPHRRLVVLMTCATTLLLLVLLGITPLWLWLVSSSRFQLGPASIGMPLLLPPLRFTPLGDESGWQLLCEDFAALLLVAATGLLTSRQLRRTPRASRRQRLLAGWGGLVPAAVLAGFFRGLVVARLTASGPMGWFGYPALGVVGGLAWGVLLGWTAGLGAALGDLPLIAARDGVGLARRRMARITGQLW